jgi:hypothetical protein
LGINAEDLEGFGSKSLRGVEESRKKKHRNVQKFGQKSHQ